MKEPMHWRYVGDGQWIGEVDGVDIATARKMASDLVPWAWTLHEPPAVGAINGAGTATTLQAAITEIAALTGTHADYGAAMGYRLTIEDHDPTWSEWHVDRLPDVHGMPAGTGHWWTDRHGRRLVEGYEPGAVCGGCGWHPGDASPPP